MKPGKTILTIAALLAAPCAFAGEFGLNMISARDIQPSYAASPLPAPAAELAVMDVAEAASYLADRESSDEAKAAPSAPAAANLGGDGVVTLYHQWHRETLEVRYRDERGRYIPEALAKIKRLFRCRLTGQEMAVPEKLVEVVDALQDRFGAGRVTVICGFRSPELNGALAEASDGVARRSLHMSGLAADIRIDGVRTSALRDAAKALRAGGVGYYPSDGFVHVDVGPVRYW